MISECIHWLAIRSTCNTALFSVTLDSYDIPLGVDMVDWEAVRVADPADICDAIRCRGMYFLLTGESAERLGKGGYPPGQGLGEIGCS